MYGFVRTAAAVPTLKVAECDFNTAEIIKTINMACEKDVDLIIFPELSITGYTCADLFFQKALMLSAEESLNKIIESTKDKEIVSVVGLPVVHNNNLFNCCAAIYKGKILGVVPKTHIPNYGDHYEKRWFKSGKDIMSTVNLCGQDSLFSPNIIFEAKGMENFIFGVEICEDVWSSIPPSCNLSSLGALIILNASASNESVTKSGYRLSLIASQSARILSGYVYTSSGIGESTQDSVFSGHSIIGENGNILVEGKRFLRKSSMITADIDTELLLNTRIKNVNSSDITISEYKKVYFDFEDKKRTDVQRFFSKHPFVPENDKNLGNRCQDIFNIQVAALSKRIDYTNAKSMIIGVSGGLDSTLALLVAAKTCDFLEIDRKAVIGVTMPGFGTTGRTHSNATKLAHSLGVSYREIPIRESCLLHFENIGHNPEIHDTTYENTQARERTQILMDLANMENGLVIGTGDLSELALGWATYNGDHMAMYGVNSGIPKTLVKTLVEWVVEFEDLGSDAKEVLQDILNTPVSPELLPPDKDNKINQKTEEIVGPYELHDFFLYYVVRCSFSPKKVYFLAKIAFEDAYDDETILKWLKIFYTRFFSQQYKRSCLPDGPKVGTVSLSPRSDWKMPSDGSSNIWTKELDEL